MFFMRISMRMFGRGELFARRTVEWDIDDGEPGYFTYCVELYVSFAEFNNRLVLSSMRWRPMTFSCPPGTEMRSSTAENDLYGYSERYYYETAALEDAQQEDVELEPGDEPDGESEPASPNENGESEEDEDAETM